MWLKLFSIDRGVWYRRTMENDDIEHAGKLILASEYVVSLTGADISMESGIRPFRGPGGL